MAKVTTIMTRSFVEEKNTQGSHPSVFDCTDGNRYFVKHSQLGRNYKHLINEYIASLLGGCINLSMPEFALVEIIADCIPLDKRFALGIPSGIGFGSKHVLGNILYIQNIDQLLSCKSFWDSHTYFELLKTCAFDIWLLNGDRNNNNLNLLAVEKPDNFIIVAIDHAAIFDMGAYRNLEHEKLLPPPIGYTMADSELLSEFVDYYGLFLEQVIHEICMLIIQVSDSTIRSIVESVPENWVLDSNSKEKIIDFISYRKNLVEKYILDLFKGE